MSIIRGIVIDMKTENTSLADTKDPIYLGVFGHGGGREFAIDVSDYDDFERGRRDRYWFGEVWEGSVLDGARRPYNSAPGNRNDPAPSNIELKTVEYVYVKKEGSRDKYKDDEWKVDFIDVTLYGANQEKRSFTVRTDLWIGKEWGRKVWLSEIDAG